jgi:hypothetical protein
MAASPGAAGPVPGLSAETAGPVLTVPGAPLAFHVMAKPTGAICNLDCEYELLLVQGDALPGVAVPDGRRSAGNLLVGISIDGQPAMHDAYRVDKGGKPTFGRVMAGLDVLKRHGVDWNVLTTIHAVNGDHGREVYRFLRDELGAGLMWGYSDGSTAANDTSCGPPRLCASGMKLYSTPIPRPLRRLRYQRTFVPVGKSSTQPTSS